MSSTDNGRGLGKFVTRCSAFLKKRLDGLISKERKEILAGIILYDSSPIGRRFDKLIIILILLSVILVIVETIPNIPRKWYWILFVTEWVITILFTIEYVLRIYVTHKPAKYIFSFYGIVDLLAFLPSYLTFFFLGAQHFLVIRVLRLLRIFRIFKLGHFVTEGGVVVDALKASRIKIYVFLSFVGIISVLIGTMMYMLEHPHNDAFSSIASGIYWCIVTITTVGYGDVVPQTGIGRFLATFVMILGYGVLAVPTGIVTAEISSRVMQANAKDERECLHCGERMHFYRVKYCHNCGERFTSDEMMEEE